MNPPEPAASRMRPATWFSAITLIATFSWIAWQCHVTARVFEAIDAWPPGMTQLLLWPPHAVWVIVGCALAVLWVGKDLAGARPSGIAANVGVLLGCAAVLGIGWFVLVRPVEQVRAHLAALASAPTPPPAPSRPRIAVGPALPWTPQQRFESFGLMWGGSGYAFSVAPDVFIETTRGLVKEHEQDVPALCAMMNRLGFVTMYMKSRRDEDPDGDEPRMPPDVHHEVQRVLDEAAALVRAPLAAAVRASTQEGIAGIARHTSRCGDDALLQLTLSTHEARDPVGLEKMTFEECIDWLREPDKSAYPPDILGRRARELDPRRALASAAKQLEKDPAVVLEWMADGFRDEDLATVANALVPTFAREKLSPKGRALRARVLRVAPPKDAAVSISASLRGVFGDEAKEDILAVLKELGDRRVVGRISRVAERDWGRPGLTGLYSATLASLGGSALGRDERPAAYFERVKASLPPQLED